MTYKDEDEDDEPQTEAGQYAAAHATGSKGCVFGWCGVTKNVSKKKN